MPPVKAAGRCQRVCGFRYVRDTQRWGRCGSAERGRRVVGGDRDAARVARVPGVLDVEHDDAGGGGRGGEAGHQRDAETGRDEAESRRPAVRGEATRGAVSVGQASKIGSSPWPLCRRSTARRAARRPGRACGWRGGASPPAAIRSGATISGSGRRRRDPARGRPAGRRATTRGTARSARSRRSATPRSPFGAALAQARALPAYAGTPPSDVRRALAEGAFPLPNDPDHVVAALIARAGRAGSAARPARGRHLRARARRPRRAAGAARPPPRRGV